MNSTPYQIKLEERFRRIPLTPPPAPWEYVGVYGVGGLENIGFAEESELLLIVSSSGRGVLNCTTGERVARDYDTDIPSMHNIIQLQTPGIGPLTDHMIRMAGLHGGGLSTITHDGWHLEVVHLTWHHSLAFLEPSSASIYHDRTYEQCVKVYDGEPIRAYGFSYTGESMVIAEGSHSLHIFTRATR
ncbi:MAG: hypothetical protein M3R24_41315 [Chloroflexota bacterium]|nr:hypothetical protein [Chloroflexota bacterium]